VLISLSPASFLERACSAFGERPAIVDGHLRFSYAQFAERAFRLAGMLMEAGIRPGERIAALCVNSHVMLELHNGVPLAGAVLVPVNIRLSVSEIVTILEHSGTRMLIASDELLETASVAAERARIPLVAAGSEQSDYELRLRDAAPGGRPCSDENALIAINYTSGSTGRPKGVMYTHRGAYLQALAMACHVKLAPGSSYLWTLPMFHCDGWCFTWAVTAAGSTHVCQRKIDPAETWRAACERGITHLSAAPTVLLMLAEAADAAPELRPATLVEVSTGGAPPSPALLARLARLGLRVTHLYGLTETYGPCMVNEWQPEWSGLPGAEQSRLNARQGIGNVVTGSVDVLDASGAPVPADGETIGEIVIRGNNVMLGYYRDEAATRDAFAHGSLRTGDLGVRHPDGYVELKDRLKDIIISGGENIASVEVEQILAAHPEVLEAAVVARPDSRWGEVPVAFVALREGAGVGDVELIEFVRARTAHFKAPKAIFFAALPKTSTGKIQKHVLRSQLRDIGEASPRTEAPD
jgi:fatty-acyl-CoA synthase